MITTPSIIVPGTTIMKRAVEATAAYTSGKVVDDYISDNIITPLRDTAVTISLLYAGALFILVGIVLLALNTNAGKVAAKKGVSVATGGVL